MFGSFQSSIGLFPSSPFRIFARVPEFSKSGMARHFPTLNLALHHFTHRTRCDLANSHLSRHVERFNSKKSRHPRDLSEPRKKELSPGSHSCFDERHGWEFSSAFLLPVSRRAWMGMEIDFELLMAWARRKEEKSRRRNLTCFSRLLDP